MSGESPGRVLVIDGDPDYRAAIVRCVELAGAGAEAVDGVGRALRRLERGRFDATVWGLPPGVRERTETVHRLHAASASPLILLDESYEDAREMFEAGADQLLPKPFVPGALVGALKAALRPAAPEREKPGGPGSTPFEMAGLAGDAQARTVGRGGRRVPLTGREWELLTFLVENPNRFFTADQLVRRAWTSDRHSPEQLRSYVTRLRRKLEPLELPARLVSRQGRGYSFRVEANGGAPD